MYELLTREVLFSKGDKEAKIIELIYELLGSPNNEIWPGVEQLPYYN